MAERLQDLDGGKAETAGPDQHDRLVGGDWQDLLDGGIDGQARAGVGGRHGRIDVARIDQMAGMRHEHVAAETARLTHADGGALGAEVVLFGQATFAFAAAHPGEDDAAVADLHALAGGVRTQGDNLAHDLMAEGEGQLQAHG